MRSTTTIAVTAAFAFGMSSGYATADILDFGSGPDTPSICSGSQDGLGGLESCASASYLHQSYGDVAGTVDVSYSAPRITGSSLGWWDNGYNDLFGVAWADFNDADSQARIDIRSLQPDRGIRVTSLDLGSFGNEARSTTLTITDLSSGQVLYTFNGAVGDTVSSFTFSTVSSTTGVRIEWADSAYNVGIDNIAYDVTLVPEPETYALMLAGLGLVGGLAIRRRRGDSRA